MTGTLRRLLVLHEPEAACRERLKAWGIATDAAAEMAFYLAQATDFAGMLDEVAAALAAVGVELAWEPIDRPERWLPGLLGPDRSGTVLWCLTDGFAWYRGSFTTGLAALLDVPQLGSPPEVQHLCQDKFRSAAVATALGARTPPMVLVEDSTLLSPLAVLPPSGPFFVKSNRLGGKLGIEADSRVESVADALALTRRIRARYGDQVLIQPFVPGHDVRVSFMDLDGSDGPLGMSVVRTNTEAGFPTLADSLRMTPLAAAGSSGGLTVCLESPSGTAAARVEALVRPLARGLGLRDYWSMDLRLDEAGEAWFLEFEVCPAVTIYDFRTYLRTSYGLDLPEALARLAPAVYARRAPRSLPS